MKNIQVNNNFDTEIIGIGIFCRNINTNMKEIGKTYTIINERTKTICGTIQVVASPKMIVLDDIYKENK